MQATGALLDRCIRCGLCLPACPTYGLFKSEMDGPRGRLILMRALADGRARPAGPAREHLDLCLGCRACEAACPSGVEYGELLGRARELLATANRPAAPARLARWLGLRQLLPHPRRLRWLARGVRWARRLGLLTLARRLPGAPSALRRMAALAAPAGGPAGLPELTPAIGERRGRVSLFRGCVQDAFLGRVNAATARVLGHNGFEVRVPRGQTCCGAAAHHLGEPALARELARRNLEAFAGGAGEAVVTNAGGCGAMLAEYGQLFAGHPEAEAARAFAARVRDVTELLAGHLVAPKGSCAGRVTYADSCHLRFARGVADPPRDLLRALPGLDLVELDRPEVCCGSAGVFNLLQGETADRLLADKVADVRESGAAIVATSNPGCQLQIASGVRAAGLAVEVAHVVELLDRAYAAAD